MSRWLYTFAAVSADRPIPAFDGEDAAAQAESWLHGLVAHDQAALAMYATQLDGWHGLLWLIEGVVNTDDRVMRVLRQAAESGVVEIAGRELSGCRVGLSPNLDCDAPGVSEAHIFAELINQWVATASATGSSAVFVARPLGPSLGDREFRARA